MTDRYAVVWTRTATAPIKMGNLVATEREMRFSYTPDFLDHQEVPGLSLMLPPTLWQTRPFVHQASEILPLLPRLMALIPSKNTNNIQRRIYTGLLAQRPRPPAPGFETEWELLMLTGHNGIGHIDVFPDDRAALEFYSAKPESHVRIGSRSEFWHFLKNQTHQQLGNEALDILRLIGPTPSVGGQIPKLLVSIPDKNKWDGAIAAPGTRRVDGVAYTDVVMKLEDSQYQGITALEFLCLQVHRESGFDVPRHWRASIDDLPVLAVERFDRTPEGGVLPLESFFSVYATGQQQVRTTTDAEVEQLGMMILKLSEIADVDAASVRQEVYRRFVLALLTGNGDLHLENLAFLGGPKNVRLAPVFDPAPMRAWDRHDLLSALPFYIDDKRSLAHSVARVGEAFGLSNDAAMEILRSYMKITKSYPEQVLALKDVPLDTKKKLAARVKALRAKLAAKS